MRDNRGRFAKGSNGRLGRSVSETAKAAIKKRIKRLDTPMFSLSSHL